MAVPYTFGTATSAIPLSQLDSNFSTPITLGNTAIQLGNTVTTLNNMTLANVTVTSGSITLTSASAGSITNTSLTAGRVVYSTTGGLETDSANLTFDGTNLGLGGGTANGVAYLNGSKVLTTGSAPTFDGSTFNLNVVGGGAVNNAQGNFFIQAGLSTGNAYIFRDTSAGSYTEYMRLTSTGLGIGTSSPGQKLDVYSASTTVARIEGGTGAGLGAYLALKAQGANAGYVGTQSGIVGSGTSNNLSLYAAGSNAITLWTGGVQVATLDTSGNLGLGVTPSAWTANSKAMQIGSLTSIYNDAYNAAAIVGFNQYHDDPYP